MENEENTNIVDTLISKNTGVYYDIHIGDTWKITSSEQKGVIKKVIKTKELNEEIKEWNNELGGFVFVLFKYSDTILSQHPDILSEDITKLFYLATFVDYDGFLVDNNSFMTRKSMQEKLKLSRKHFDLFFNKMKKSGIILQDENKNIKINKEYFSKGEVDKEIQEYLNYTRVYIKTIQYLYDNVNQRKHKQLGMYFKLIPYIHRQQNVLALNPESNISDLQVMRLKDLKDILGYHRNSVRPFINELLSTKLDNGEPILGFFIADTDFWKSAVIVNPRVFYGGNFDLEEGKNAVIKWFGKLK